MQKRKEIFFHQIYEETYDELLMHIKKIYRYDSIMAEDILQETYLRLYKKIDEVMKHENAVGWIKTTAKYVCYQLLEKNNKIDEILGDDMIGTYDSIDVLFDDFEGLRQFISEDELSLIRQYFDDGYSLDELAQNYQISKGAVKMRIQRIVKKVKRGMVVCLLFV